MRLKTGISRKKPADFDRRVQKMIDGGMNSMDMAEAFGVTRATITKWLHDERYHAVTTWVKLERAA